MSVHRPPSASAAAGPKFPLLFPKASYAHMATPLPTIRHDTATPGDRLAGELRGFGPAGIVAIAVIALSGNVFAGHWAIPLGGLLVLVWTHVSGTPWRAIGYVRSKRWMAGVGLGLGLGVAFKLAMKAMVMPLLGADPINHAFHYLAGNRALLPSAMWMMLVAGFGEETVFRGFAFERLGKCWERAWAPRRQPCC